MPVHFPDASLDPVADDRAADLFAYRRTKSGVNQVIGTPDNQKTIDADLVRHAEQLQKISAFAQSYRLGKGTAGLFPPFAQQPT